jgi:ornithine cyclodeaminase/alanine dehydrogenase-like protein (mu-crystallin family)
VLALHSVEGAFHIKAGILGSTRPYFVAKGNTNFAANPQQFGLPAIQGVIVLCDAVDGRLLALLDSIEITIQRTGAATAVAAKYLARPESRVVTICGCGNQGRVQLRCLKTVLPLERVHAFDADARQAQRFAGEMSRELGIKVEAAAELGPGARASDVVVTCTPSTKAYFKKEYLRPGAFLAAVGADAPDKQELESALLVGSKLVTDITDQCATLGELHHALEAKLLTRADVHAELGEVVAGRKPGRTDADEITIFDSTGMALQDAAATILVYEKGMQRGAGLRVKLGE